ncbi:MAG: hypothetical protein SOS98_00435 [Varibaculum sp.]|nr:hypothetical protein [Varibaculum sp.]
MLTTAAILAVWTVCALVFYHVFQLVVCGGFLGVDLLFVISGFLITTLLFRERRKIGRNDLPHDWSIHICWLGFVGKCWALRLFR